MKKYLLKKGEQELELSYSEIAKYQFSAGFMSMLENLKIGEKMFNYDLMAEFTRIA